MCGIAGIVSFDGITESDRRTVASMLDALAHRGPDGRRIWADDHAVLGHARLAIIDPIGGAQPIANEDGGIRAVVNGEIYNFRELRAELESRGHVFRTAGDAEVVVHLYEEMGVDCLDRLRGMFALAVWDSRRRRILLARDKIGVKPLYFARLGNTLIFASQLDAVLEHEAVERRIDLQSLHQYLVYHYVPSPRTMIRGVSKLGPAERAVVSADAMRVESYWDVSFVADDRIDDEQWEATVRTLLRDSVSSHLIADVPVGVFLSGGLDSATVAALAARVADQPVKTFTVGFDDPRFDERADARALASRLGAEHHEEMARPDPLEIVESLTRYCDEPMGDPSAAPAYCISQAARRHVKVVLSGDGGDEVFAGYSRYRRHARERLLRSFVARRGIRRILRSCSAGMGNRARAFVANLTEVHDRAHYLSVAWFDPQETWNILDADVATMLRDHDPFDVLAGHFARCDAGDSLSRSQYVDLKTWLPDGVLFKADRASMACGLEVRVPMLDTFVVERMARLPRRLKLRRGRGKVILRDAMRPILGNEIVDRRKRGFEVPLDAWFTGPLAATARELLLSRDARVRQWIRPAAIEQTWAELRAGRRGIGARLWALLMLETWARRVPIARARRCEARPIETPPELVESAV